jgi:hypothetical protein
MWSIATVASADLPPWLLRSSRYVRRAFIRRQDRIKTIILRCGTVKFTAFAGIRVAFVGLRQRPVSRAPPLGDRRTRETEVAPMTDIAVFSYCSRPMKPHSTTPTLTLTRAAFGLSKIEYLQWVDLDGAPLCGHRAKRDDLCRNMTGGYQLRAA